MEIKNEKTTRINWIGRNCHDFDNMLPSKQKPKAQKMHAQAKAEGKTCIVYHKGIAHLLPKEYIVPDE